MAKTAIITGSSRGIGAASAILFAKKGFNVVLQGRNKEKLQGIKEECEKAGAAGVLVVELELSNHADLPRLVEETIDEFGGLDVLVNNAGMGCFANLEEVTGEMMDLILGVNVKAPILISKAAMPHLKKSRGAIVNVSSLASHVRSNNFFPYAISKAALDQFSLILSGNYAPDGIRVNTVRPAAVATDIWETSGVPKEMLPALVQMEAAKQPCTGMLTAEEIAQAIWMCCDPALPSMTGQNITIHGGRIEDKPWVNPMAPQ
ncbi:Oidioi.mRNA.OKI2018_I69.chr1.g929.t1.cds [Oikopleura dioica]|uniref:Oidioi.mRNA.OKI2018_I69.chr1.g929.t1.cds n=1 Tax=Oikopleura dioica TaxID=34765 RepID=A0ABN7SQ19_OIKDI|nr:Oidioi.mRNA.OKI2018_I69.chr1.g929.t1.cds [Oikopleura dioica]